MSQINVGGVVKGGLAAGLVMNISEFVLNVPVAGDQMNAELAARNLPPVATNQIAVFVASVRARPVTVGRTTAIRPAWRRPKRRSSPASRVGVHYPTCLSHLRVVQRMDRSCSASSGPVREILASSGGSCTRKHPTHGRRG